jgi:hypothetical protein
MPYYSTLDEDLARARAILATGRWPADHPTARTLEAILRSGTLFGEDLRAAYQLLARFVAELERLTHALNTCEVHAEVPGIRERTACAVCFTEALAEVARLQALAYLGDHQFPDLTYKARLEELVPEHRRLQAVVEALRGQLDALRRQLDAQPDPPPRQDDVREGWAAGWRAGVGAEGAERARLRAALEDIATADPTMDDARALQQVAKVALQGGRR